jgi:hypothetical protein
MSDKIAHLEAAPKPQWLKRHGSWLLVGLAILFVVVVRVRLREMPLERDEGEYAYAGQLMLQGVPPYKEAYNMKLPGTYAAYAVIMAVLGQTASGIHLGVMVVNVASIVLVFLVGRKLLDEVTGVVAAICFALMSLSPSILGLAGHATHFVVLFALGGTLVLMWGLEVRGQKPERESLIVAALVSGLLFGLAFLMKQQGVFFGAFGLLYLLWLYSDGRRSARAARGLSRADEQNRRGRRGGSKGPDGTRERRSSESSTKRAATPPEGSRTDAAAAPAPRLNAIQARRARAELEALEGCEAVSAAEEPGVDRDANANKIAATLQTQARKTARTGLEPGNGCGGSVAVRSLTSVAPVSLIQPGGGSYLPTSAVPLSAVGAFVAGQVAPYLLTCLILLCTGTFHQFVFWTITYAAKYASAIPLAFGPEMLRAGLRTVVGPNLALWILPWAGALMMWWDERMLAAVDRRQKKNRNPNPPPGRIAASRVPHPRVFVLALLLCSAASVSVGLYFREHYFILVLPVLALLSGLGVSRSLYLLGNDKSIELFLAIPAIMMFVVALGAALVGNGSLWLVMPPEEAMRSVYGTTLFSEAAKAAVFLKTHAAPAARISVLGSEPEIYFRSRLRSATQYIYTYPLMEAHPYAGKMQEEMISEIERSKPAYIVYVDDHFSWLRQPESNGKVFDWWKAYSSTNVDLAMTFDLEEGIERIGDMSVLDVVVAKNTREPGKGHLFIFKRKE